MASAYSNEVSVGAYNRIRLRVDYSGTSASCHIEFSRASSWTGQWSDYAASITLDGTTQSSPYDYSGTVDTNWREIASASGFTVPTAGGTLSWSFNNPTAGSVLGCSGTIDIPAQATPPTGLALSNLSSTEDSITGTVSITGWGGAGDATTRYLELSLCDSQSSSSRYWNVQYGNAMSATITVDANAQYHAGSISGVSPNTNYYATMYATNGTLGTGNTSYAAITTLASAATVSLDSVTETTATIAYSTSADGGAYPKTIQYSLDGTTWVTGATVSTGSASSGTFTITGLSGGTTYNVQTRATTTAGSTAGPTVTVTTSAPVTGAALYGSVGGNTKKVKKLYGPVNGQTKLIKKLYGPVNGLTKLIYQE